MSGLGDSIFTRGQEEGRILGQKEGRILGQEEGRILGQEEGQFTTLYRLVEKQLLNVSQAAQEVGLSEQEFTDRMAAAGYQTTTL